MSGSFVLGFHGCDREIGERLIGKEIPFDPGNDDSQWLGSGIYFWQDDPLRALEWAQSKQSRGKCNEPFVLGAVIDLGRCLDLQRRENLQLLSEVFQDFQEERRQLSLALPENRRAKNDPRPIKVLRYLDHAVIETVHKVAPEPFDTVLGTFSEGDPVYPGSGILGMTHSQIAVRTISNIKHVFAA